MALKDEIPVILDFIKSKTDLLKHNESLFNIYEGDLVKYVLEDLRQQLSQQSFDMIQHRIAPVNVLKRLVDKLSKIYSESPARWLESENPTDAELFGWYSQAMGFNTKMQLSNEFFNLFKNVAIEPYVDNGRPCLRVIPSDRFLVMSMNRADPTKATHFIKHMGQIQKDLGKDGIKSVEVYYVYTKDEFLPINSDGEIVGSVLEESATGGVNPIGRLPAVYASRSMVNLIPPIDSDTLRMTKIFPVLLSDLNFSVMFQAFSIIYGIDVDNKDIVMSPNAFWNFKSDPATQSKPEVGVIKPQVDIQQVVGFIGMQLSFWLQSRGIRPGAVGNIAPENMASGLSKVVDEMDTYEERQKQVPIFMDVERELWDLIMHGFHPYWVREGLISERRLFEPRQVFDLEFPPQRPMTKRMDVLTECEKELSLRLMTRKAALQRLNPNMSEEQVDEYIAEIDREATVDIPGDSTPIAQGDHAHSLGHAMTGPMLVSGEGHYHIADGVGTSIDPNSPGHTHTYDGERTGPPVPLEEDEIVAEN